MHTINLNANNYNNNNTNIQCCQCKNNTNYYLSSNLCFFLSFYQLQCFLLLLKKIYFFKFNSIRVDDGSKRKRKYFIFTGFVNSGEVGIGNRGLFRCMCRNVFVYVRDVRE